MRKIYNVDEIIIRPEDIKMLREMRNERMIFLSNHPTTAEPGVAYYIANLIRTRFYYMAGREVFNWSFGFNGFVMSRAGAFSFMLGTTDWDSIRMARSILAKKDGKLVPVSWEQALKTISITFQHAVNEEESQLAGVISPRLSMEALYLFKEIFSNYPGNSCSK